MNVPHGSVAIVGVGPGDPDLLTLRALRVIERSNSVLHPGKQNRSGFAYEIVADRIRADQEVEGMALAMKRGPDDGTIGYDRVAQRMIESARNGLHVCYLTEGDPLLFGSGAYVSERVRSITTEIPIEIVPGVTALSAAAGRLGWGLAGKEEILTVCPATYHVEEFGALLDVHGPICFLKVADVLSDLIDALERSGRMAAAALVEKVGRPDERVFFDLKEAQSMTLSYFSLVLVR